ncbi:hypothetical protein GCM10010218_32620 [Streptomyces mashuensis]|uniref:DUF397 domain-containing protein n=1 Tax=Streptomyces mashuensis TaxID=33904 RepID=A0A919EDI3_9ACTN|nr:hypothetical protein GCM10010218_32620 [Streptomyces mashuensis]
MSAGWCKSSYSTGANNNCVEVSRLPGADLCLREGDQPAVAITTTPAALAAFLRAVKSDRAASARAHLRESDDPAVVIATAPVALAALLRAVKAHRLT